MVYLIYFLAAVFVVLSALMFFAYYRTRHFGLFIMALTYAMSGLLAAALPHWWPLATGFVLAWLLRLIGLEPNVKVQESRDEGGGVSREFEEGASAPSSRRTPAAMQRGGPGSETRDEEKK